MTATADPDPRVAGRGLDMLRAAGIAVTHGVLGAQARWLTRGHIVRVTERRPFVQVKMALGGDGVVPRGSAGQPVWATGAEARAHGHLLRAEADAILVGSGTVRDDDPELTCRLPGMADRSPLRVVLASQAELSPSCKLVRTARGQPTVVFHSGLACPDRLAALELEGVRTVQVPAVAGQLWLPAIAEALAALGMTRLLVEGGPAVWSAFARIGLIDEVVLYHAHHREFAVDYEVSARHALAHHLPQRRFALLDRRSLPADEVLRYGVRG